MYNLGFISRGASECRVFTWAKIVYKPTFRRFDSYIRHNDLPQSAMVYPFGSRFFIFQFLVFNFKFSSFIFWFLLLKLNYKNRN